MAERKEEIYRINGDFAMPSPSGMYGNLDGMDISGLSGWLVDMGGACGSVMAHVSGLPVASGALDIWRQDVADLLGSPKAYGFRLSWLPDNLRKLAISPGKPLPIVFSFNDRLLTFGNFTELSGDELLKILEAFPRERTETELCEFASAFRKAEGREEPAARLAGDVRLIAWYLPQFHPIPENDAWWGAGFTEWTNVAGAKPMFKGHVQPQIPADLGFYDLRLPEARQAQADLAREYGIYGFCYYYYWFQGKKLLEKPLEEMLRLGKPDFPFCICWANESWSRRWNGSEEDVLIAQRHEPESDAAFMEAVIPILLDPRYIRLDGAPLLLVYRAGLLADPAATAEKWRETCRAYGIPHIHLCAVDSFSPNGLNPLPLGFDSAVQFPPHHVRQRRLNDEIDGLSSRYLGSIFSYAEVARAEMARPEPDYTLFPGVMTAWDNTPRRGRRGDIYYGATPEIYEAWLRSAMDRARAALPKGRRLVFINAWNEWAEGAHLEPDLENGRAWLEATRRALTRQSSWRELLASCRAADSLAGEAKEAMLTDMEARFSVMQHQLDWYESLYGQDASIKGASSLKPGAPAALSSLRPRLGGKASFDQIGPAKTPLMARADKKEKLYCVGWALAPSVLPMENTLAYFVLLAPKDNAILYNALIIQREERPDLAPLLECGVEGIKCHAGFRQIFDLAAAEPGIYRLGLLTLAPGSAWLAISGASLEIMA